MMYRKYAWSLSCGQVSSSEEKESYGIAQMLQMLETKGHKGSLISSPITAIDLLEIKSDSDTLLILIDSQMYVEVVSCLMDLRYVDATVIIVQAVKDKKAVVLSTG